MARSLATRLGQKSCYQRPTMAMDRRKQTKIETLFQNSQCLRINSIKSRGTIIERHNRRNQTKDLLKQINRSSEKEYNREKNSVRYEHSKQAYSGPSLSHVGYKDHKSSIKPKLLLSSDRFERRLLACANKQQDETLSGLQSRAKDLQIQSHALWAKHNTTGIFKINESNSSKVSGERSQNSDVFRRLVGGRKFCRRMSKNDRYYAQDWGKNGNQIQFQKVRAKTHKDNRMAWSQMEYIKAICRAGKGKPREMSKENFASLRSRRNKFASMGITNW